MTPLEQAIIMWIHLLAAAIWVGGSLFIGIVFSPLLKTMYGSSWMHFYTACWQAKLFARRFGCTSLQLCLQSRAKLQDLHDLQKHSLAKLASSQNSQDVANFGNIAEIFLQIDYAAISFNKKKSEIA